MLQQERVQAERGAGKQIEGWKPPPHGKIKLSCDRAWDPDTMRSETGVIARDSHGTMINGRHSAQRDTTGINAEVRAVLQVIELTLHRNWEEIIESDYEWLIKQISGEAVVADWRLENIISTIKRKMSNIPGIKWKWIKRQENKCTDWIAKQSRREMYPINWVFIPPIYSSLVVMSR